VRAVLDDTGTAILDQARRLLLAEGPDALTVRRIAAEAGCSTMGLYSRFGGKEGVIDELYCEGFARLRAAIAEAKAASGEDDLRACLRAYRRNALENPAQYLVMFGGVVRGFMPSDSSLEVGLASFDELAAAVERAQQLQLVRSDHDARDIAEAIWSTVHGQVMLELLGKSVTHRDGAERYELLLDQIQRGWAPEP
jgi:AcrR family transcriptional regulator